MTYYHNGSKSGLFGEKPNSYFKLYVLGHILYSYTAEETNKGR